MTRIKGIMFLCFCIAFGAGVAAGVALTRPPAGPRHGSWLGRELNLTPAQEDQMHEIWSSIAGPQGQSNQPAPPPHEQRRALQKERDEAVRALLNDEQKARYDELFAKCGEKLAALDETRKKAFDDAVERTKAILTEAQRKKYDELLQKHAQRRGWRGLPGKPGPGPKPPERGKVD